MLIWIPMIVFLMFVRFNSVVFNKEFSFTGRQCRSYPTAKSIVYGFPNSWIAIGNKSYFLGKVFPCRWNSTHEALEFFSPIFGAGILRLENILGITELAENRFQINHDSPEITSPIFVPKKLIEQMLTCKRL
jgi:hypothetical protein